MRRRTLVDVASFVVPMVVAFAANPSTLRAAGEPAPARYGELPLAFEENTGQAGELIRFVGRGSGYTWLLTRGAESALILRGSDERRAARLPAPSSRPGREPPRAAEPEVLRLRLLGAREDLVAQGQDRLAGQANYFIGKDPKQWHTGVPLYGKVRLQGVYPGVDLAYYGNQQHLEQDFIVAAGADPSVISIGAEGHRRLWLDSNGDLVVAMRGGEVRLHRPLTYQEADGRRQIVPSRYVLKGDSEVGFAVPAYDVTRELVIDPVLSYSTLVGGAGYEAGSAIAVDSGGNAYVTGQTTSANFPATPGAVQGTLAGVNDAFVVKLNPAGTALVYASYLGGSGADGGSAIAVDAAGNAYITGTTQSTDFPTTSGAFQTSLAGKKNAFVAKLNAAGTALVYSTYLGGAADQDVFNTPLQDGLGIAVDSQGAAYVTGRTDATDFPVTPGAFQTTYANAFFGDDDAFVTKLSPDGSALEYSTYIGHSIGEGHAIAIDAAGDAFIAGMAAQSFPTTPGAFQTTYVSAYSNSFVTKLNPSGSGLIYSTYIGGNGWATGVAIDASGNAYVTGLVDSVFPTTAGAFQPTDPGNESGYVTKLNPTGSALVYSTFLGGSLDTEGHAIGVDGAGNAYVTGMTNSTNFPATAGALQSSFGGGYMDAYLTVMNPLGTGLVYSTYLGGSGTDSGGGVALDSSLNAYVTGGTDSPNFPTTPGAFQTSSAGGSDAFVLKIGGIACSSGTGGDDDDRDRGRREHQARSGGDGEAEHHHKHRPPCSGGKDDDEPEHRSR